MFMRNAFMFFLSLGIGYVLCMLAKKQEGMLKSVGYTLGISILAMSLIYAFFTSTPGFYLLAKMASMCSSMPKFCLAMR